MCSTARRDLGTRSQASRTDPGRHRRDVHPWCRPAQSGRQAPARRRCRARSGVSGQSRPSSSWTPSPLAASAPGLRRGRLVAGTSSAPTRLARPERRVPRATERTPPESGPGSAPHSDCGGRSFSPRLVGADRACEISQPARELWRLSSILFERVACPSMRPLPCTWPPAQFADSRLHRIAIFLARIERLYGTVAFLAPPNWGRTPRICSQSSGDTRKSPRLGEIPNSRILWKSFST